MAFSQLLNGFFGELHNKHGDIDRRDSSIVNWSGHKSLIKRSRSVYWLRNGMICEKKRNVV